MAIGKFLGPECFFVSVLMDFSVRSVVVYSSGRFLEVQASATCHE